MNKAGTARQHARLAALLATLCLPAGLAAAEPLLTALDQHPASHGAGDESRLGGDLAGLLAWVRDHNPEFAAMRYDAEAAAARVGPAGALPDPILRTELQNVGNAGSSAAPNLLPSRIGSTKYTVLQTLPGWGKRDLKQGAAAAAADEGAARRQALWADLASRLKSAYAQYDYVVRSQQLTDEITDLSRQLEQFARQRYASGRGEQQDVIRAQLEISALRSEQLNIANERHHLESRLNVLLDRPPHSPLSPPRQPRATPAPASIDGATLAERLAANSPLLLAESARLKAAEQNRELTYRNRYPDLTVGISPMQMGNRIAQWDVMFEINLPLQQGSRRAQEREAEASVNAAQARRQSLQQQAQAELADNLTSLANAHRQETLVANSLLPQAELTWQAALGAYQNGKVDFATVLDAQRQIRKARQDVLKYRSEGQQRLADIERLLGEDL